MCTSSGRISYQEFNATINQHFLPPEEVPPPPEMSPEARAALDKIQDHILQHFKSLRKAFLAADREKDGHVTPLEFLDMFNWTGIRCVPTQLHFFINFKNLPQNIYMYTFTCTFIYDYEYYTSCIASFVLCDPVSSGPTILRSLPPSSRNCFGNLTLIKMAHLSLLNSAKSCRAECEGEAS